MCSIKGFNGSMLKMFTLKKSHAFFGSSRLMVPNLVKKYFLKLITDIDCNCASIDYNSVVRVGGGL